MRVVAVARRKEKLEMLQQHMHLGLGIPQASFLPVVCDITKDAEVRAVCRVLAPRCWHQVVIRPGTCKLASC